MRLSSQINLAILLGAALAATVACQSARRPRSCRPRRRRLRLWSPPASRPIHSGSSPPQPPKRNPSRRSRRPPGRSHRRPDRPRGKRIPVWTRQLSRRHLEAAKQNFDSAFNQLLGSGFDLRSSTDDRLERELDRILDGINALELAAYSKAMDSPSKIRTRAHRRSQRIHSDRGPQHQGQSRSRNQIDSFRPATDDDRPGCRLHQLFLQSRTRHTGTRLARSGRYEDMIRRVLREEGVPQDLIYLAQAESGFHPVAVSRAGARGMWQFMGSRAAGYGLERNCGWTTVRIPKKPPAPLLTT